MPIADTAPPALPLVTNRLRAVLLHVPYYSIEGAARLAADTGFSRSTITRLCSQKTQPSFRVAEAIAWAVSKRSGRKLNPGDIFSTTGDYATPSTCALMGCAGCFPHEAWDEATDTMKPAWKHQKPGDWSRLQASPILPATIS